MSHTLHLHRQHIIIIQVTEASVRPTVVQHELFEPNARWRRRPPLLLVFVFIFTSSRQEKQLSPVQ